MMKYFTGSYIVTAIGFLLAYIWGEHVHIGSGFECIFIALVLSILEISLSFDNAVVNAARLEKMSPKWQHRFLTWGIIIAVFGMRFLFPILVVSIFANVGLVEVAKMAISDADRYAHYLHVSHPPIITFGGTFLMMLFFSYFFNSQKDIHWIKILEEKISHFGDFKGIQVVLTLFALYVMQNFLPEATRLEVVIAGIWGVMVYLLIDGLTHMLDKHGQNLPSSHCGGGLGLKSSCFAGFLYLELIDASFSLDGVLGAFALSKDILIITIGLSIGAMFVRSLTIMLVEKKTLTQYIYLEHGAHWAIGALSVIMLFSAVHEVPEVVTGLLGLGFIIAAFVSSLIHNKRQSML